MATEPRPDEAKAPVPRYGKTGLKTSRSKQKRLETLSPFELKNYLIGLARGRQHELSASALLNAGRGNPNWVATEARDGFFLFGQFAMSECRRAADEKIMAGMPARSGIATRFRQFLEAAPRNRGRDFLKGVLDYGVNTRGFDADAWIHELTDSLVGDNYPTPPRMLVHCEQVVHDYLMRELCASQPPEGRYDLFATEGGTAAMCYVFDSLMQNGLLHRGDKVAIFLPTFTPYIEIAHLERFSFEIVPVNASRSLDHPALDWHFNPEEIAKLEDPSIRLAVLVNPSNPPSVALSGRERNQIIDIVRNKNPDLMVVTDDVYGTFVDGFRSLMADIPQNTICVYSFSKNFGCTGWRLGVIALHQENRFDLRIRALDADSKARLARRYGSLTLEPEKLKFIDRMVADSRDVALNHTAGLSLPQQVQMALFALSLLLDTGESYRKLAMRIVRRRRDELWQGMALPEPRDERNRAWYYVELDFMLWARAAYGEDFCRFMRDHYEPVDFLFRLAERSGVVLLDGGGFGGPPWSIRISLANLTADDYADIGRHMHEAAAEYVEAWRSGRAHVVSGPDARSGLVEDAPDGSGGDRPGGNEPGGKTLH